jgi:hypothetical protein
MKFVMPRCFGISAADRGNSGHLFMLPSFMHAAAEWQQLVGGRCSVKLHTAAATADPADSESGHH